jgi:hypothetical protein
MSVAPTCRGRRGLKSWSLQATVPVHGLTATTVGRIGILLRCQPLQNRAGCGNDRVSALP